MFHGKIAIGERLQRGAQRLKGRASRLRVARHGGCDVLRRLRASAFSQPRLKARPKIRSRGRPESLRRTRVVPFRALGRPESLKSSVVRCYGCDATPASGVAPEPLRSEYVVQLVDTSDRAAKMLADILVA